MDINKDSTKDDKKYFPPTVYALKKSKVFWLFLIMAVIFGVNAYQNLPKEWTPDVQIPLLVIATPLSGSSPIDSETLITRILENEFQGISGVKKITSVSTDGVSVITLEFDTGFDVAQAKLDVKDAIDVAKPKLPATADDSELIEINLSEWPIYTFNLSSDLEPEQLKLIADDIAEELEGIAGVLEVVLSGGIEKEMQVLIDPSKLSYHNISIKKVIGAIAAENKNIPSGNIDVGAVKVPVRVPGEVANAEDLENIIISSAGDKPIYLKDVADKVVFGNKERGSISRIDNQETISLAVSKRAGENLQRIVADIEKIKDKWEKRLVDRVEFVVVEDHNVEVERQLDDIFNTAIIGFVLVVIVLMLVMGVFNSIMVAFAIPLSILMGFIILDFAGITMNMVVLFSLVMTLGLVVDDAIVVVENIYRHLQMGQTVMNAVKVGVYEIAYPVITSTLTTLAAFFPLIFIPGIMGDFMKYLPYTMIATLISSLLVALFFNPLICSTIMHRPKRVKHGSHKDESLAVSQSYFFQYYKRLLTWALDHNYTVIFSILGLFVFVFWLYFFVVSPGVEFFPKDEPSKADIAIEVPYGSSLSESNRVVGKIEEVVAPYTKYAKNVVVHVGTAGSSGSSGSTNKSRIAFSFPGWQDRLEKPSAVVVAMQNELSSDENLVPGSKVSLNIETSGPPAGKPVNIEIRGEDLTTLKRIANDLKNLIVDTPGLINLDDDLVLNQNNITITPNRAQMANYNISTDDIGFSVRTAISGTVASTYKLGEEQYDIVVRYPEDLRTSVEEIKRIPIITDRGTLPLAAVADIKIGVSPGSINHTDKERTVSVSGDALEVSGANLLNTIKKKVAKYQLPEGYRIVYSGEDELQKEVEAYMPKAFFMAIFLIFLLMAWEFNSLKSPFVILGTVFLSLIGVLIGLIVHVNPFSILMGGIGIVSLAGIVVKNGIVLIDYIIYKREQGIALKEAIILSCMLRVRPIFLTASTAILALMPILIGMDINFFRWPNFISFSADGGEIWRPLANAIVYGLAGSTVLTLLFVPCFYYLTEREVAVPLYKKPFVALASWFRARKR